MTIGSFEGNDAHESLMNFSYDLQLSRFSSPSAIPSLKQANWVNFYTKISIFFSFRNKQTSFVIVEEEEENLKMFRVSSRVDGSETIRTVNGTPNKGSERVDRYW